jgi:hypothetical protein
MLIFHFRELFISFYCLNVKVLIMNLKISDMRTTVKTGMVIALLIAGTMTLSCQNKSEVKVDTSRMHHGMMQRGMPGMRGDMRQMPGMRGGMGRMHGMPGGMGQMHGRPGMQGMNRGGWGMGPGREGFGPRGMMFNNIPNLTDKQKKDIAVLRIDQQTEMKKLRDAHRAAIEKILTPEQKKWLDENTPKPVDNSKPGAEQTPVQGKNR